MGVVSEIVSERAVMGEQKELYDARAAVWRDVLRQIAEADIANMTPVQALNLLSEMQMRVQEFLGNPVDYVGKKLIGNRMGDFSTQRLPKAGYCRAGRARHIRDGTGALFPPEWHIHPVIVPNPRQSRRLGTT